MRTDLDLHLRPAAPVGMLLAAMPGAAALWCALCPGLMTPFTWIGVGVALWSACASVARYAAGEPPFLTRVIVTRSGAIYGGTSGAPPARAVPTAATRVFPALTILVVAFVDGGHGIALVGPGSCPLRRHARLRARLRLDPTLRSGSLQPRIRVLNAMPSLIRGAGSGRSRRRS